jgi:hypothetical protein
MLEQNKKNTALLPKKHTETRYRSDSLFLMPLRNGAILSTEQYDSDKKDSFHDHSQPFAS